MFLDIVNILEEARGSMLWMKTTYLWKKLKGKHFRLLVSFLGTVKVRESWKVAMDEAEKSLDILARKMTPILNPGEFVFCTVPDPNEAGIARGESVCEFREAEGVTVVIDRSRADILKLDYDFIRY